MTAVSDILIAQTRRVIPVGFTLLFAGFGGAAIGEILRLPMQVTNLSTAFVTPTESFTPKAPVTFNSRIDTTGRQMVMFSLADQDSAGFSAFTGRHIGEVMQVKVCDAVLMAPMVMSVVSGKSIPVFEGDALDLTLGFMVNGCP